MRRAILVLALVAGVGACAFAAGCTSGVLSGGGELAPASATEVTELEVHAVEWNASKTDVGAVSAVVEMEDAAILFGGKGATVVAGGAVHEVVDGPAAWTTAAVVPGADGVGPWIVGVDGEGHVLRLRARTQLEVVGDRWGLGKDAVRSVARVDDETVAFGFASGIAVADGEDVRRFTGPASGEIVAGGGRIGWVDVDGVHVVKADGTGHHVFALDGARAVAIEPDGRVVAITDRELWVESGEHGLVLRWTSDGGELAAMATSNAGTWITVGADVALLRGDALARSRGAAIEVGARPFVSSNGDLWIVAGGAARKIAATAASEAVADWTKSVQPVYARVCASCHGPGGSADLSTYAAWVERRAEIEKRVLVDGTMPPKGVAFSEEDREALRGWLERAKR